MKILARTIEGGLIIEVTEEEFSDLGSKDLTTKGSFFDTDVYRLLRKKRLPAISWRRFLAFAYSDGEIDGTINDLKSKIKSGDLNMYSKESALGKILQALSGNIPNRRGYRK